VPALPPHLIEPIWQQFKVLLPEQRPTDHQALDGGGRQGHDPRGHRERPRKPPRLAARGPHTGCSVRGAGGVARGGQRPPRARGYDSKLTPERLAKVGL
jgi:hypothetical protein